MPLFETPPVLTPEQERAKLLAEKKMKIKSFAVSLRRQMEATYEQIFNEIWYDDDVTPQEVFNMFGTDAVDLFVSAGAVAAALNAVVPGTITQVPPYEYVKNADGTVTVGARRNAE